VNVTYNPPIRVSNSAVHSIDDEKHQIAIVFYVDSSDFDPQSIPTRFVNVLQYLMKEEFISSKVQKWNATAGVVIGKPPEIN
jgi:hypothetical protein